MGAPWEWDLQGCTGAERAPLKADAATGCVAAVARGEGRGGWAETTLTTPAGNALDMPHKLLAVMLVRL